MQGFTSRSIALWLLVVIQSATRINAATVSYVTTIIGGTRPQQNGSTEGGTLLWVYGTGFAPNEFSLVPSRETSNTVQLVRGNSTYDCGMQIEKGSDTQLTCYTPPMPPGEYQVRVSVQGILIPLSQYSSLSSATFIATSSNTPQIVSISPASGLPQRLVTLRGNFKTRCYLRDMIGCSEANVSVISRIYIGGQLCNLMDSESDGYFADLNDTQLQCRFESNEVGVFNVSMLVSNEYGRSSVDSALYRMSGSGQLHNFETYAVLNSISSNSGSVEGGTILTIEGNYFSESSRYPLVVNVGDEPCHILSASQTSIQCQTPIVPLNSRNSYHGGRGLHISYEPGFIDVSNLVNASPPMPSNNTNRTWTEEASLITTFPSATTVWFIGFVRVPITAAFKFQLDTNSPSVLYLSSNEDPANKLRIATSILPNSNRIVLQKNTDYYILCIGSTSTGSFRLTIKASMQAMNSRTGFSSPGVSEIQRIEIGGNVVSERQRVVYTTNTSLSGVAEVQDVDAVLEVFQIGYQGVYTGLLDGPPPVAYVQESLNDLPSIYPLSVTVALVGAAYRVTFPMEMGDVQPLTMISKAFNQTQTSVEIVRGVSPGPKLALQLDGATTNYLNFRDDNITDAILTEEFLNLFKIRCPPSLNNPQLAPSIVYVEEFESSISSDQTLDVTDVAFCGRGSMRNSTDYLVLGNALPADFMCFAYKIAIGSSITMNFLVASDGNTPVLEHIPLNLRSDARWHYKCLDLRDMLEQSSLTYLTVTTFVLVDVNINFFVPSTIIIDTVTLRNDLPIGYEDDQTILDTDHASTGPCVFPFLFNGKTYSTCISDENNIPICGLNSNRRFFCQNSSIEGVRRLYPKYQLLDNSLQINHSSSIHTIDLSFRYTSCQSPSLIQILPSSFGQVMSLSNASKPISGSYSIDFDGKTYSPIPAALTGPNLANVFQSFSDFGFVTVTRTGECYQYQYNIQWLVNGEQPLMSINNSSQVRPINAPISISSVRRGSAINVFYTLPNDVLRTYHTTPQVEVVVGEYPSLCSQQGNNCEFQRSMINTPTITSVTQTGSSVTIQGTGFSTNFESNIISIGESGSCTVQSASATTLVCSIINAPSGQQSLKLNIAEKGLASTTNNYVINVPLTITSFTPTGGDAGGGFTFNVVGTGFSSNALINLGENFCLNQSVNSFTTIQCIVPPSSSSTLNQVRVTVNDGPNSALAPSMFTYNMTASPTITSINPTFVLMSGGVLTINGTGFGSGTISVLIDTINARILSSSNNQILVSVPSIRPGLHPIRVRTSVGFARPLFLLEYRFYVQQVSPQVGSSYGGNDIYLNGVGFENRTRVQLRDGNDQTSPCEIISIQPNQIHCQTTAIKRQMNITSYGSHPSYGFGYSWNPIRQTVQQGTVVNWFWDATQLSTPAFYRLQQLDNAYSTTPMNNGFDSGPATPSGSFSYQFDVLGTFYYWSPNVNPSTGYAMRGAIEVVPLASETLTIEAVSGQFIAQICTFPFIFNSINYTTCTSANDTRPWCSPTSMYAGQRLYCTPAVPLPVPSCSWTTINANACSQTVPTSANPDEYLSTTCSVESISSVSPTEGPQGTILTITGPRFGGSLCEYQIQIGSSYHCPLMNMTSTELSCQIGALSMLDPRISHSVRVAQHQRGFLASENRLEFRFLPSISRISPTSGSTAGGSRVTIDGDGFIPEETLTYIVGANFTSLGSVSYSQIVFTTPSQSNYVDMDLDVFVSVRNSQAECLLLPSCSFNWATSVTPHFDTVTPRQIRGRTNLTINGSNLLSANNTEVKINGNRCNITQQRNNSLQCTVMGVEAGIYRIEGSIDGVGNVKSLANVTSDAFVSTVTPLISGVHGGAILTVEGNGFSSNRTQVQISVGSIPCPVVEATESRVRCTIPPQTTNSTIRITSHQISFPSSFVLNYNASITPNVSSVSPNLGSGLQTLTITGENLVGPGQTEITLGETPCNITSRAMRSISCTVDSDLPAGNHTVRVNVEEVGDGNENVIYRHDLTVTGVTPPEGGYGGGLSGVILGNGFNGTTVSVSVCNRSCASVEVVSNGRLICETPSMAMSLTNTLCNLTVEVDGIKKNTPFTYKANLTSTITSVGPNRGGTGGGTTITINGTNFPTSINSVSVSISGVPCQVQTVTQTSITCVTGPYRYSSIRAPIIISVNGSGNAVGPVFFQYIDLWSSQWTWGGEEPPESGTLVVVENQVIIYLDIETPILRVLIIDNATLVFEDSQDVTLNAEYIILINGGRLQVGTESSPFEHRGVINVHGHLRSIELPIFGAKVLAIREGSLDMHGLPTVRTWTRLGATASNGSSTLTLLEPVNWPLDSLIVIATTSDRFSQKESELRRIRNISSNGLILTLDRPLIYTHLGLSRTLNSTVVDLRAEIGLLSHNVVFQGSVTESWDEVIEACPAGFNPDEFAVQTCFLGRYGQEIGSDQFGAMININPDNNSTNGTQRVAVRLSNVEVFHVGQAFRLDRYAIHFQRNGNMNDSYVKSCSIHESYNRAIHIQATDYLTIENNVIYNIMGNAMFLSDGIEIGNVFRGNLAVFVRTSSSLLNEDLTPAAFWLSNPNNTVEFNAVAGATHYGYWYRFDDRPQGLSLLAFPNFCPNRQPFGRFVNNTVHSTGRFGVWIYPEYGPTLSGDCNGTDPTQATLEGLIAWRNNKGIEVVMSRTIQIKNTLVFENNDVGIAYITAVGHQQTNPLDIRPTFSDSLNGSMIVDSVIIGDVGVAATPVLPNTAGLVVMWDRGLRVRNVVFINFLGNATRAISGPIILDRCSDRCGGWITSFSNISFVNVTVRGRFRWAYDGLYHDEDGTLAGQPNSVIMAPDGITNTSLTCSVVPTFDNAIQCPRSEGAWLRFSFREILERPLGRLFVYNDVNASTITPWLREQLTYPNGYLLALRANQSYTLRFETLITSEDMRYTGVVYDVAPGDFMIIQHWMNVVPYRANTTIDNRMILGSPTPLSGTNSSNGDWFYDSSTSRFSYIVKNPLTANASIDIELSYQIYVCPCNSCFCPTTTTSTTSTSSATTASTTSATTVSTTSQTTTTTTSATTTTSTSATTTTSTSATTITTTSATTTTTTTTTSTTATTTTTSMYLPPIQPCYEYPTAQQLCQSIIVRYWSIDSHWTFGPQDYSNWAGVKPGDGQNIFVPRCYWLIIDYPLPRIRALKIEGVVEFQRGRNHVMNVDTIIINGGRFIAGLPTVPFNESVDIILSDTGPLTVQLPSNIPRMEQKMIGVMGGLDLHGIRRGITWTRLATTATSGQNLLVLRQPVNWIVGDEIIVTTTDTNIGHTERHRIATIQNGTIIQTTTSLSFTHLVIRQSLANGYLVSVEPAVGLLTRNIRIIDPNPGGNSAGFRLLVSAYQTNVFHIYSNQLISTCYKGYLRMSNTQLIGFGVLDDSYDTDKRAGIYFNGLGDYDPNRETFIDASAFDGGFNAAISLLGTNGVPLTNNIVFNTYRSGLVITGTNNLVQNNLVTSVFWLGTGQSPPVAQFNFNNDGAIMTKDVNSVRLMDNLVVGVERLAYRIQGETCGGPSVYIPPNITNEYSNNEAHSAMAGVSIWPSDKGFIYDRNCVLVKGFKVYKAWYYAFYLNSPRNITIDSCSAIDSHVGFFTYVLGPSALSHTPVASRVTISNTVVIGSITPGDCNDTIDQNSINIRLSLMASPKVSDSSSFNGTSGRSGIVFPQMSRNNYIPIRSWTGIGIYPSLSGLMTITNSTLAFFNDVCNRHDVAIQVSQRNDDGQFPINTRSMFVDNSSRDNLVFNGQPNLGVVNPSRCGDMDCDGLKKNLLTDTDGSLFGHPASVFSQAESLWGSQEHGIGDFRIPRVALTNLTGQRININLTHPYRGISRTNSCSLQSPWGMYLCNATNNYRMLIIESMDSDTEKRRISPVAIMSKTGYIDLINGPQDQTFCNGYSCRKRISTFMAIVQSGETYEIYFSSNPPRHTRFRLLNADPSIKCVLALYYNSLQQIDVYANTLYVPPTNRDLRAAGLMLLDQTNGVSMTSPPGSNFFDRTYQQAFFAIDGNSTIDVKISPLLILSFGFPPMNPASFFSSNLVANLAALLNINPDKIRRVNIVSAWNNTRIRRQSPSSTALIRLTMELRDEPRPSTTAATGIRAEILANIASTIINRYQAGELQIGWRNLFITNGSSPSNLSAQEPYDDFQVDLSVINRLVLVIPPSDCRYYSPCTTQPVLVAYDAQGNVVQKLGSNDRPWQVKASLVLQPNVVLAGGIANYTNGQTQYSLLSLPDNGPHQVQFTIILPDGVNGTYFITLNLTDQTAPIPVSPATLAGRQVNNVYVVNGNQRFSLSVMPIDSVTRLPLGQIQWGTWRWSASVSPYTLPSYNRIGSMSTANSSTAVSLVAGTITVNNLAINATGMYLISMQCVSSNNQYSIDVLSNGVLVKQAGTTFITEVEALSSNITFRGDFDALNASDELEIKRATIYNYLLSIGMPLISDLLLLKGSSTGTIVALFEVEPLATIVSIAVSTLLTTPNAVPGLSVLSININSRTYEVATTTTSTTASTSSSKPDADAGAGSNNTGLIVGLTVGIGGGLAAIAVAVLSYKAYQRVKARNLSKVTNINVQPKPTEATKPSKPNSVRPMPLPPAVELLRFD